jgi:hypothetical protein
MDQRIYGVETEYGLSLETQDRGLRPLDPGMLFNHMEAALLDRFITLESDSFGRDPGSQGDGIEIREGRFLESGARFYYDTGHLEWATPECRTARQAALYELAGERTLVELARSVQMPKESLRRLLLLKNNVDYAQGTTFGCHENYLLARSIPFPRLVHELVPFLVTRQIFTGTGKLGSGDLEAGFQISQRADFVECIHSNTTRSARAIINERDESLGDARRYRRLHLILGDSNRSSYTNLLKLGTTGLVLRLIEAGALGEVPVLADPVAAIKAVSQDLSCQRPIPLANGGSMSPVEVQYHYLSRAASFLAGQTADDGDLEILDLWCGVLDDLAVDPVRVADRVDWMIKRHHLLDPLLDQAGTDWRAVAAWSHVLAELQRDGKAPALPSRSPATEQYARFQFLLDRHGLRWNDYEPQHRLYFALRERDLRYHDIDPERGLFSLLEKAGRVVRVFKDEEIAAAQGEPPPDTRARLRAEVIRWAHRTGHTGDVLLDWGRVAFAKHTLMLADPFAVAPSELNRFLGQDDREVAIRILGVEEAKAEPAPAERESLFKRIFR